MADDERPARQQLQDLLEPLLPKAWLWVTDERPRPDDAKTRVQLSQRTIEPGTHGSTGNHSIGFVATITVPQTDLQLAEDQLDDDVVAFLHALTNAHYKWTTATKAVYDGRLGYQLGLSMNSKHEKGNN